MNIGEILKPLQTFHRNLRIAYGIEPQMAIQVDKEVFIRLVGSIEASGLLINHEGNKSNPTSFRFLGVTVSPIERVEE